jgi:TPP-dependent 2-oxoacid decarboxylase
LSIRYHNFEGVRFKDFCAACSRRRCGGAPPPKSRVRRPCRPTTLRRKKKITIRRLFQRLNSFLRDNTIVISDVGDALFGAADLNIHQDTQFLGTAYYASMGFAVPAAIGAQLARPERRPLVLVGDGAFQMTGMELTTAARHRLNPIVIVLNNAGYGTERHIQDGPYNDVAPWNYHLLPDVIGHGRGFSVETEEQLENALRLAEMETETFTMLDVHLDPLDRSPALDRLARNLASALIMPRPPQTVSRFMDTLPTVLLKPGAADRVVAGHPWIYAGSLCA